MDERQKEIERRLLEQGIARPVTTKIPQRDAAQPVRASSLQERLWLIDELSPNSSVYNVVNILQLDGHVDVERLSSSFVEVVERHHALRTTLRSVDGNLIQVVNSAPNHVVDVRIAANFDEAVSIARAEGLRAFDLERGPLFRIMLVGYTDNSFVLSVDAHHAVVDGWSIGLLLEEVSVLYQSKTLMPVGLQFGDVSEWQRTHGGQTTDLAWWRQYLNGAKTSIDFPVDRRRQFVESFDGACVERLVPADLVRRLREVSQEESATLYMTLLTAFAVVCHRYASQDDVLIATPSAGRNHVDLETVVGPLINTRFIRTRINEQTTLRDVLHEVRNATLLSSDHDGLPFEQILSTVYDRRDTERPTGFDALFLYNEGLTEKLSLPGVQVTQIAPAFDSAKADITFDVTVSPTFDLHVALVYASPLFEPATVECLLEDWIEVLVHFADDLELRVSSLVVMNNRPNASLIGPIDDAEIDPFSTQFDKVATERGNAVAVVVDDVPYTYEEIKRRSDKLAAQLASLDVKNARK